MPHEVTPPSDRNTERCTCPKLDKSDQRSEPAERDNGTTSDVSLDFDDVAAVVDEAAFLHTAADDSSDNSTQLTAAVRAIRIAATRSPTNTQKQFRT